MIRQGSEQGSCHVVRRVPSSQAPEDVLVRAFSTDRRHGCPSGRARLSGCGRGADVRSQCCRHAPAPRCRLPCGSVSIFQRYLTKTGDSALRDSGTAGAKAASSCRVPVCGNTPVREMSCTEEGVAPCRSEGQCRGTALHAGCHMILSHGRGQGQASGQGPQGALQAL